MRNIALEIFKLFGSIFVNNDEANKSIAKTDEKAEGLATKFVGGVKTASKWGAGIATAATAAATAMTTAAASAAATADDVDKMSAKIGISREAYQEWKYVLGQNGMEISKLQTGMKTLTTQISAAVEGSDKAKNCFDTLGVSISDESGALRNQEDVMNDVLMKLADMEDGVEKTTIATTLFGKAGIELAPMLKGGSDAIISLKEDAHNLGLIIGDDTVDAGVKLGDTMDNVKQSIGMLGTNLSASFFPVIQSVCDLIIGKLPDIQSLFQKITPVLTGLFETIMPQLFDLVEQLLPIIINLIEILLPPITEIVRNILPLFTSLLASLLPPIMQIAKAILPIIVDLIKLLLPPILQITNAVLPVLKSILSALSPILNSIFSIIKPIITFLSDVLIVVVNAVGNTIKSVANAAVSAWNWIKNTWSGAGKFFSGIWNGIKNAFGSVGDWFKNTFSKAWQAVKNVFSTGGKIFDGIKDGIVNVFKTVVNAIIKGINKVISIPFNAINSVLQKIHDISILGVKPFTWINTFNVPQIPLLAKGGIVKKPTTAVIGEEGEEAIVPLKNNTEWIDTVVGRLNSSSNSENKRIISLLEMILSVLQRLDKELYNKIRDAITNGTEFQIDDRNFARLVKKYV